MDLDTTLGFPCEFDKFYAKSFGHDVSVVRKGGSFAIPRWFRVVTREEFLQEVKTDKITDRQCGWEGPGVIHPAGMIRKLLGSGSL